ncbi:MAG TPA: ankyrin repeat domain-containing protein, partial [Acidimicrobiales bacterium]|nr:ankyrin repeat domain-containing protein [Acidimicrobiales bacterium]
GADPNAGYLCMGLIPPFTAITGFLGNSESDRPGYPGGSLAPARLLLEAGADANDDQTLYNRQFGEDDSHFVLLFEFGLGGGDGGIWNERLGGRPDPPAKILRTQLEWAIVHDMTARVALLVDHGVDFLAPYEREEWRIVDCGTSHGRTPAEVAALAGCDSVVELLVERGAVRPAREGVDGLIAAVLAGDQPTVARLQGFAEQARTERPALVVWAASRRKLDAIRQLVSELGFDVNARGRTDVPFEQEWETSLHHAAGNGDIELVRLLLELGADPDIEDGRFHSTPLGWAEHFDQGEMADLLRPLTAV